MSLKLVIWGYCIGNEKEDHTMYMKYGRPRRDYDSGIFLGVKTRVVVSRGSNNALPNRRRVWTRILHDTVQIGS
jgi:hypothetical protein